MNTYFKLATASVAALMMTACASTDVDDSMRVGGNDNDQFASTNPDVELSDAQTFGINDDDNFEAVTVAPNTAVASRVIRTDTTITGALPSMYDYSTVTDAVVTAGLADTFDGDTEYTVFAPSNTAFSGMDLSGASKADLQTVLKGHVVAGRISSTDLQMKLDQNGGTYMAQTLSGDTVTFMRMGDKIKVADKNGYTYDIDAADNEFKNGYVHGISGVLGRTY